LPTAPAEVFGDLADRVRAGAGGEPLGDLAAKLAVAEPALRGRGGNSGAVIGNTSGKAGRESTGGARFAMTQVINYREFPRDFRVRQDAISPFPRQSTPFRFEIANYRANSCAFRYSPPPT
jgi:hypothetical protein